MKKLKVGLLVFIFLSITLSLTPAVVPQIGTYTFHGAPGDTKILKINTVNNASLNDLFGAGWVNVIESFGPGAANVGARKKSLVTAVNTSHKINYGPFGIYDGALYNTSNWDWTTGEFSATPDSIGDVVESFYDPTNLTYIVNAFFASAVTVQNGAYHLAQLPTPVAQYLGAIVWAAKWQNVGNTVVHNADAGDWDSFFTFQYLEDCTEIWEYDSTYGAWIGYKILDNETNTIYEFSIELAISEIPGFELSVFLGITAMTTVGIIYTLMKKKNKK
ncbi:MAG: hypothetical protein WBH31_08525 [Promethearchaeia archaeon]